MIRVITTAVIDCDFPGCEEVFVDPVDMDEETAHRLATTLHHWTAKEFTDEREPTLYFCPKHPGNASYPASMPPKK